MKYLLRTLITILIIPVIIIFIIGYLLAILADVISTPFHYIITGECTPYGVSDSMAQFIFDKFPEWLKKFEKL